MAVVTVMVNVIVIILARSTCSVGMGECRCGRGRGRFEICAGGGGCLMSKSIMDVCCGCRRRRRRRSRLITLNCMFVSSGSPSVRVGVFGVVGRGLMEGVLSDGGDYGGCRVGPGIRFSHVSRVIVGRDRTGSDIWGRGGGFGYSYACDIY